MHACMCVCVCCGPVAELYYLDVEYSWQSELEPQAGELQYLS